MFCFAVKITHFFISEEVSLTPNFQVKEQLVFPYFLNTE